MIAQIIETLQSGDFYGAGPYTEIAKGKHEIVTGWRGIRRKIKRARKCL
jgi:hypothetical protein